MIGPHIDYMARRIPSSRRQVVDDRSPAMTSNCTNGRNRENRVNLSKSGTSGVSHAAWRVLIRTDRGLLNPKCGNAGNGR